MKGMKIFLGSIYVVLIILLLLSLMRCNRDSEPQVVDTGLVDEEPIDTTVTDSMPAPVEDQDAVEQAQEIGNSGALKITLLWNFKADIDLHVVEPNGFHIYYSKQKDPQTGGELDKDNIPGGPNSAENIFWTNPPSGRYHVSIKYFSARTNPARSGECTVVIFREGREPEVRKVMMSFEGQVEQIVAFTI